MPQSSPTSARRAPLAALIGVATALVLALVLGVLQFFLPGERVGRQEAAIRAVVDDAAVAASYDISTIDGSTGAARFVVGLDLAPEIDDLATGALLTALFEGDYSVGVVDLRYQPGNSLRVAAMHRGPAEFAEVVDYGEQLPACDATISQLGPTGMAVYRLDLEATVADPLTSYERLLEDARPDWLSLGQLYLTTASGQWPKHIIEAGRELTPEERERFRELDAELSATISPGEKYSLQVVSRLGEARAQFTSRVVPAVPPSPIDPTSGPADAGDSAAPGPAAPAGPPSSGDSSDPATDRAGDDPAATGGSGGGAMGGGSSDTEGTTGGGTTGGGTTGGGSTGGGTSGGGSTDGGASGGGSTDSGASGGGSTDGGLTTVDGSEGEDDQGGDSDGQGNASAPEPVAPKPGNSGSKPGNSGSAPRPEHAGGPGGLGNRPNAQTPESAPTDRSVE